MSSVLQKLRGSIIESVALDGETKHFNFSSGNLSVFNPVDFPTSKNLLGAVVDSIEFKKGSHLNINLQNRLQIKIGLKDSDYQGPEAFCMHFKDGVIVVE